ncbi:MAG: helix-turn-helix domain-containing protein [Chloroflexia bacterium]|nr:helix-turn-helix domain-containing protein [Chloroflexia bacterium]
MKDFDERYSNASTAKEENAGAILRKVNNKTQSIETGKFAPSVITALKISKYFNTTVQEIFQLDADEMVDPVS